MTSCRARAAASMLLATTLALSADGYPLDGYDYTGIERVRVQRLIQEGALAGRKRPGSGELLPMRMVDLRLTDMPDFELPAPDPALTARVKRLLGPDADRYGIALLDLSDRANPRYAEVRGRQHQTPGSVGKILVALALFQALADAHPDDVAAREKVLRESRIRADVFSHYDHHTVPLWDESSEKLIRRPLRDGDTASMWTYLDWMMSPSSNSAAGMLQKHLILLAHYGVDYPVSPDEEKRFFEETPRKEREAIFLKAITEPVTRNGLDLEAIRQGSFFTREGKRRVSGTSSYATPRSLTEFLLKMEQGKLVDAWSSREIKRLMYVTERRIRYASSGVLRPSAVYFKSGSLYSCQEEEGFVCKKYHGNKRNYMNSIAVVETPAGQEQLFYMVSVLSNVLRKNSAGDHRDLAKAVHGMLLASHADRRANMATYGEGFIGYESERAAARLKADTQEALLALGYDIGEIDGIIGRGTRAAIRTFQKSQSLPPDGEPSPALLETMWRVGRERGLVRPAAGAAGDTGVR